MTFLLLALLAAPAGEVTVLLNDGACALPTQVVAADLTGGLAQYRRDLCEQRTACAPYIRRRRLPAQLARHARQPLRLAAGIFFGKQKKSLAVSNSATGTVTLLQAR